MKIRINQTVEVDPEAWATEYGIDIKDVREDVKTYFAHYCQEQVERLGLAPEKESKSWYDQRASAEYFAYKSGD